ncbi:MAG: VOC family protein [Pirellulales bacterium]|jgi:catechol-2,3-dioxygenase
MPNSIKIYETVLYANDLDAAKTFYTQVMELRLLSQNELMLVLSIDESYLLIFNPDKSLVLGRQVPSHGTSGQGHIAFVISEDERDPWKTRLAEADIEIESEIQWDNGARGTSIYFRDPAGNSIELAPPNLWTY